MLRTRLLVLSLLAALWLQAIAPDSALAHERRTVGKYTFVVGFLTEPAFEGEPNGASVRITTADTNQPVEGPEKTLKAAVAFGGGQPKEFPLQAQFRQPGSYVARFIPTRSGAYSFTFTGTVDGQAVSEKFESGPGRFNDVESPTKFQFPEPVPPVSEVQRTVATMERRVADAEQQATEAEERAKEAQTWAMGGLAVGALGLLSGLYGLVGARRREAASLMEQPSRIKSS